MSLVARAFRFTGFALSSFWLFGPKICDQNNSGLSSKRVKWEDCAGVIQGESSLAGSCFA